MPSTDGRGDAAPPAGGARRSPSRRRGLSLALVWLAVLLPACERSGETARPNVVLISIDSLRADHLGAYGYPKPTSPEIDRLAAEGVVFENAFSTTSWTLPSHVALFAGANDLTHTVVDDAKRVPSAVSLLPEVLQGAGYQTIGFFSGPFLHPGYGLGRGFDEYHNCTSYSRATDVPRPLAVLASHKDVTNPIIQRKVRERVEQGLREPFFVFMHFWDVHYDYVPPDRYWRMFDGDYDGDFDPTGFERTEAFGPEMPREDFEHVLARYDGEIRYTDDTIKNIFAVMDARGLLDDTVIVVTADHGEEFLEHGGRGHRRHLFDEALRIPLIVWYPPRLEPGRDPRLASITDVAPTIAALTGVDEGFGPTGRSLLEAEDAERVLLLNLQVPTFGVNQTAVRSATGKVVHDGARDAWNGYALELDPGEQRPATGAAAAPELAELRRRLDEEVARAERRASDVLAESRGVATPGVDEETKERLRALGYL